MSDMMQRARQLLPELTRLRRDIHRHPELAFQEVRTAALVADTLREIGGFEVRTQVGKTGVVASMGTGDGPTIGIRADMDALPLNEATTHGFVSQTPGTMHACGHDAHTAIVLGVAHLLKQEFATGRLRGNVRLLFQPAEELGGDGVSGAPLMMQDGALVGVDHVIALHVASAQPLGTVGIVRGPVSAAADGFRGWICGTGGHGAYPHQGTDPIAMTAAVIQALNSIVSRRIDPMYPAVCSLGMVQGGSAFNVIPTEVQLAGTLRSFNDAVREQLFVEVERAFALTEALGGSYRLELQRGYPSGMNDATVAQWLDDVASDFVGTDHIDRQTVGMAGEDFAYMQQQVPGAMMRLGAAVGDMNRPHHTPVFDIDERAMPIGAAILAETVRRHLTT